MIDNKTENLKKNIDVLTSNILSNNNTIAKALIYKQKGYTDTAIQLLKDYLTSIEDDLDKVICLSTLSDIEVNEDNKIMYLEQALESSKDIHSFNTKYSIITRLAELYANKNTDKSIDLYIRSLQLLNTNTDNIDTKFQITKANVLYTIANLYNNKNTDSSYIDACKYIDEAVNIYNSIVVSKDKSLYVNVSPSIIKDYIYTLMLKAIIYSAPNIQNYNDANTAANQAFIINDSIGKFNELDDQINTLIFKIKKNKNTVEKNKNIKAKLNYKDENNLCNVCNSAASNRCQRCKKVFYCSSECQKKDWKTHRNNCT